MIKKGDKIRIRPEWQDDGDATFDWIAREDEDGGRVCIQPINTGLHLPPNQIVTVDMVKKIA